MSFDYLTVDYLYGNFVGLPFLILFAILGCMLLVISHELSNHLRDDRSFDRFKPTEWAPVGWLFYAVFAFVPLWWAVIALIDMYVF